ncbi:DNA-binding FadR family transcriptional regulator [Sphingobium xanthum]|jgi:DNA-binding FadR family transcriptional regulator|uniref:GntR family transcriptional regulator n=1 Tax=Sphingobium xanthum TaxID=1387165 RepID=UPI001C8BE273|nr:GntR family transcriptional regulator [Sphingobium xanthum]
MSTAERIYSASTNEDGAAARLAEKLARRIEDDIASNSVPTGGAMGSLRELSDRYGVGRAAAREAVGLLERRGLGRLRPGPCGGFIVAQPEAQAIGTELANYFRMTGITLAQLKDARDAVDPMAARLAVSAEPDASRIAELLSCNGDDGLGGHLQICAAIAELTGEPATQLFVECLNDLTTEFLDSECTPPEGGSRAASDSELMREALEKGDVDAAMTAAAALGERLDNRLQRESSPLEPPGIETTRMADDRTLSTLVARKISAQILSSASAGQRLGSEWDLCERFSVGRATLRQAIRQLQDNGLVECRRGRGNGLIVRDVRGPGSIRLVVAFLISRQMDPMVAGTILFELNRFIPALAISRANGEQRERLMTLLDHIQHGDLIDRYDLLRLVQYVSQLANSPIIDLFSRCVAAYEARFHPLFVERLAAGMQAEYFDLLRRLLAEMDPADKARLDWAKQESSRVMLAMSKNRPI